MRSELCALQMSIPPLPGRNSHNDKVSVLSNKIRLQLEGRYTQVQTYQHPWRKCRCYLERKGRRKHQISVYGKGVKKALGSYTMEAIACDCSKDMGEWFYYMFCWFVSIGLILSESGHAARQWEQGIYFDDWRVARSANGSWVPAIDSLVRWPELFGWRWRTYGALLLPRSVICAAMYLCQRHRRGIVYKPPENRSQQSPFPYVG